MRWLLPLLLILFALPLPGEELVATGGTPIWVTAVASIVIFVLTWLTKKYHNSVNAKVAQTKIDMNASLIDQKHALLERIKETGVRVMDNYVQNEMFPVLVDALDGGGFDTKTHVQAAYKSVYKEVKAVFAEEGIDVISMFGKTRVAGMVQSLVDKGIKALPEQYAKFLPDALVKKLTEFVSGFVLDKTADWLKSALTDAD
jgi:hypothetical protein